MKRLYVDGVLAATTPFRAEALDDSDREHVMIGADAHPTTPDRFFAGAMDDVRLYGFAFADADVAALQASATADFDLDGDGVPDAQDAFPADPTEWQDADFDGVGDNADAFPNDPTATSAVTWPFSVPQTGAYELWVTVPGGHNRTALARYTVSHADGVAEVTLDQRSASGEVYLGSWGFDEGEVYTLRLANGVDGYAVADRLTLRAASGDTTATEMALAFVHADHLGTPQVITGGSGEILWQGHYRPFGKVEIATNVIDNDLRFPGQLFDGESGLHCNYFRDYDPTLGRYVQSDPIGLAGGLSLFSYGLGSPVRYADPTGLLVPAAAGVCILPGVGQISCAAIGVAAGAVAIGAYISGQESSSGGASQDIVIDPTKPIAPQIPGYVDPERTTSLTLQQDCPVDSGPPLDPRDRCFNGAAFRYTTCLLLSNSPVLCQAKYPLALVACSAQLFSED